MITHTEDEKRQLEMIRDAHDLLPLDATIDMSGKISMPLYPIFRCNHCHAERIFTNLFDARHTQGYPCACGLGKFKITSIESLPIV